MSFRPELRSLAAGSLPHTDPKDACQTVLETVDIPTWPQLPRRSFLENMYVQFSERFPGVVIADEHIYVDQERCGQFGPGARPGGSVHCLPAG
jgi:hypothetical protein